MKRLILMRHAKSDWSGGVSDHDRSLNDRGRKNAAALGDWLRAHDLMPDAVLSSSATRTRETCDGLNLPMEVKVSFTRKLYLASHDEILQQMQGAEGETLLVLGHNPGIGICAAEVLARAPEHPQFMAYPTGATLVAAFDIADWSDLQRGIGTALHFVVPREL